MRGGYAAAGRAGVRVSGPDFPEPTGKTGQSCSDGAVPRQRVADALAERTRNSLARRRILALNLMSSPGSGKTTLLERTLRELGATMSISVIEGDQETHLDADRLRVAGCRVVQINTGSGGHLDADMVDEGLRSLQPAGRSLVFIENIGNLAAPALFDLGEHHRVLIASVTEGEDKPLKYPHVFRSTDLVLLNKTDLLPYLDFDVERFIAHAQRINPRIRVLQLSAKRGDGLAEWCGWLRANHGDTAVPA
ncbi:hydrogenase nickel incorporation protein HypB [Saccharopolyspora gloriosae]|uniref:hydrogenase nickel incorporation protein HypB n=1 Tax=Saccharopolyspora gloriosae TaxID=455344 RepID=UPI001FB5BF61|nr:hydrogenase nickel incorporation protein HypB [Saccharopolyspora gloriosae]